MYDISPFTASELMHSGVSAVADFYGSVQSNSLGQALGLEFPAGATGASPAHKLLEGRTGAEMSEYLNQVRQTVVTKLSYCSDTVLVG